MLRSAAHCSLSSRALVPRTDSVYHRVVRAMLQYAARYPSSYADDLALTAIGLLALALSAAARGPAAAREALSAAVAQGDAAPAAPSSIMALLQVRPP